MDNINNSVQLIEQVKHGSIFPIVDQYSVNTWKMFPDTPIDKEIEATTKPICSEDIRVLEQEGYRFPEEWHEGSLLIKNPFRPLEFVNYETEQRDLINSHLHDVAAVFRALGATSCEESAIIKSKDELDIDGKGNIRIKTIKIKGRIFAKAKEEKESSVFLKIEAKSKLDTYEARYKAAEDYIKKYGLIGVGKIENIMRAFDTIIHSENKSYVYDEDLTTELHKLFKGSLKVAYSGIFALNGNLQVEKKSYNNLHIHKDIKFQ